MCKLPEANPSHLHSNKGTNHIPTSESHRCPCSRAGANVPSTEDPGKLSKDGASVGSSCRASKTSKMTRYVGKYSQRSRSGCLPGWPVVPSILYPKHKEAKPCNPRLHSWAGSPNYHLTLQGCSCISPSPQRWDLWLPTCVQGLEVTAGRRDTHEHLVLLRCLAGWGEHLGWAMLVVMLHPACEVSHILAPPEPFKNILGGSWTTA